MSADAVAVVTDGVLGAVAPLAAYVRRAGFRPVLITAPTDVRRLAGWRELYDDVVVLPEPGDPDALAAATRRLAGGIPRGLFSCFDGLTLPAARAAATLGLPHPDLTGLATARDKAATRRALAAAGVPSVRYAPVDSADHLPGAADAVGFPAVLKPVDGTANHFVRRVDSFSDLSAAYRAASGALLASWPSLHRPRCLAEGGGPAFVLEELLTGPEYTLDAVVRGGRVERVAAFEKVVVGPDFAECAFARPFVHGGDERADELWRYAERAVAAVGVDSAAAHVEVVAAAGGPRLVEVNAGRPAGQILVRAIRDTTGVDLLEHVVALQTGGAPPPPHAPVLGAPVATYTVFPPRSGRVAAIEGLDRLAALPGVVDVIPYCGPGDLVDVRDKEVFAVNVLVAGLPLARVIPFYGVIRDTVRIRVESAGELEPCQPAESRAALPLVVHGRVE